MTVANRLRQVRQARGETVRATAQAVGMDFGNLAKIETGQRSCPAEKMIILARHFGLPVEELFFAESVDSKTTREGVPA